MTFDELTRGLSQYVSDHRGMYLFQSSERDSWMLDHLIDGVIAATGMPVIRGAYSPSLLLSVRGSIFLDCYDDLVRRIDLAQFGISMSFTFESIQRLSLGDNVQIVKVLQREGDVIQSFLGSHFSPGFRASLVYHSQFAASISGGGFQVVKSRFEDEERFNVRLDDIIRQDRIVGIIGDKDRG